MSARSSSSLRILVAGLLLLVGCPADEDTAETPPATVVVYTAHDLMFSEPILRGFEQESGLQVKIVGDTEATKTTGLVNRLIQLKDRPEADVFWNNEIMNTVRLAEMGLLDAYVPGTAEGLPNSALDPAGRWVGFAARARVILYNTDLVSAEDAPRSIFDLTHERFRGKVVIANPLFGTTSTHVAALFVVLGPEQAKSFLNALKANDVRIVAGNAMARNLVMEGELAVCLTDTDDANGAFLKKKPVEMVYPDQDELGTLIIPNTVALIKGGPNPEGGRKLVDYLASRETETKLARLESAQMPLRTGIPPYEARFDRTKIRAMAVDWRRVAEVAPESARFVQETFLR